MEGNALAFPIRYSPDTLETIMSLSPAVLDPQYKEVRQYISDFPETSVVRETNKRIIVRCTARHDAETIARGLTNDGYRCAIRKGKQSPASYIQVLLNAPW